MRTVHIKPTNNTSFAELRLFIRQPNNYLMGAIVSFYHAILLLIIWTVLWTAWKFIPVNYYDIVGLVVINNYPKYQELIAFYGGIFFTIVSISFGLVAWLLIARAINKKYHLSINRSLNYSCLICLGYCLLILFIVICLTPMIIQLFIMSSTLYLLLLVAALLIYRRSYANGFSAIYNIRSIDKNGPCYTNFIQNRRLYYVFIYIVIPIFIYLYLYDGYSIDYKIDLFHEGEGLAPLNALLFGALPYKDIYLQHGLITNVGIPWLSSIFLGNSLEAYRAMVRLIEPLSYVVLYYFSLVVLRYWAVAFIFVIIMSSKNLIDCRFLFCLPALATFSHYYRKKEYILFHCQKNTANNWLFFSGIFTALALMHRVEMGLYTLFACVMTLILESIFEFKNSWLTIWPRFLYYIGGTLFGLLPFIVYFGWHGALYDMARNIYIQCAYQLPVWGIPYPNLYQKLLTPDVIQWLKTVGKYLVIYYIPIVILLMIAGVLTYRMMQSNFWKKSSNAILLLIWFFCIFNFRTALGRSDHQHLIGGIALLWVIIAWAGESILLSMKKLFKMPQTLYKLIYIVILGSLFYGSNIDEKGPAEWLSVVERRFVVRHQSDLSRDRIGGLNIDKSQLDEIQTVIKYIQNNTLPDEPIYDFTNSGIYYFLTNRRCPTKIFQTCYAVTSDLQNEVINDIKKSNVNIVIYSSGTSFSFDNISQIVRQPLIAKYITDYYYDRVEIGEVILLRKGNN